MSKVNIKPFFPPIDNDSIITICKNEERKWNTRTEAREYFYHKYKKSSMEERDSYGDVLFWILRGKKVCSDQIR